MELRQNMTLDHALQAAAALPCDLRAAFLKLLRACNAAEKIDLPFFLDHAQADANARTAFLAGSGSILIGLRHLPAGDEPEGCLVVHPGHRRSGIGGAIVNAFKHELRRRERSSCLLVADQASPSAIAFLAAKGISHISSEHRLALDRSQTAPSRSRIRGLAMRAATRDDADVLACLLAKSSDDDLDDARALIDRGLDERTRRFYIASLDGTPVGLIRAGEIDGVGDLTAFGVLPEHRGKGIGRQMLNDATDMLAAQELERIQIEVATNNANALGLYASCGFRAIAEYGFYRLEAS